MTAPEILVIGGGIAGAGAAFMLAGRARVTLIEAEPQCGYHSTGRSAASFTQNYGTPTIRRLATASRAFLADPPPGFTDTPLMAPRGMITIARADQLGALADELRRAREFAPDVAPLSAGQAMARVGILRHEYVAGAIIEPQSMELDVAALHQGFLRGARRQGARIVTDARATAITRTGGTWLAETASENFTADVLVNAAGAWADEVAAMAGVAPLGLAPKRRTALLVPVPRDLDTRGWPLVNDVGGEFYFKRDAGALFLSPADATPSEPTDAQPDELDVALAIDRFQQATTMPVSRVQRAWAGLRTFAADGSPVAGFDTQAENFFWLAGQGGYGIKTAPALSLLAASLILDRRFPEALRAAGLAADDLAPARLHVARDSPMARSLN
jgi:D-arginine dehydrogenase